jgi:hypothetical protein
LKNLQKNKESLFVVLRVFKEFKVYRESKVQLDKTVLLDRTGRMVLLHILIQLQNIG